MLNFIRQMALFLCSCQLNHTSLHRLNTQGSSCAATPPPGEGNANKGRSVVDLDTSRKKTGARRLRAISGPLLGLTGCAVSQKLYASTRHHVHYDVWLSDLAKARFRSEQIVS